MLEEGMKINYAGSEMYVWQILGKWVVLLNKNKKIPKFIKVEIKKLKGVKNV